MPQFLILANDHRDADAINRRLSARELHLERVRKDKVTGKFITGGAKLDHDNQMIGSMLLVEFENEEAVWKWINEDPYVKSKVWEKIEVMPFRIAAV